MKYFIMKSITLVCFLFPVNLLAQGMVHISGRIIDRKSRRPLPFATINVVGQNNGTVANYNGYYEMDVAKGSGKIEARMMGYQSQIKPVASEKSQVINFMLAPKKFSLNEVVVAGKKLKYRNKGNPAVELIKKVIRNKNLNRMNSQDFYQYDKYSKIEFSLNNIKDKSAHSKLFKGFRFVFHYADTSELNGKLNLPIFIKETSSKVYYRKSPRSKKEFITGTKSIRFPGFIDKKGVTTAITRLFGNIDIYDNNILLLTNQFISPLSVIAPDIYKFHIIDTVNVNGYHCINLAFEPRNKSDFAFGGHLYITNDNRYAVVEVLMRINKGMNLNFVKNLQIMQEFRYFDHKVWALSKDQTIVDFYISDKMMGMEGRKTDYYNHYLFNHRQNDSVYAGVEHKIILPGADSRTNRFWIKNRIVPLQRGEKNIYRMIDSLERTKTYKRSANLLMLGVTGYWNFGKIDLGPVNTFYGFNSIEGSNVRLAGRTSPNFNKYFRLSGNVSYGFKDKKYKYGGKATWSLNKIPLNKRPTQTLTVIYQNGAEFPGMAMELVNQNNFFLSFKRGVADKMLYYQLFEIQHYHNWGNGFSTTVSVKHMEENPGGNWQFNTPGFPLNKLSVSEISTKIRFAPNEKYYQGMDYKVPIITKFPIFQLDYIQGIKNVFHSNYNYSKLSFAFFKRMYFGLFGYFNSDLEMGKVFGSKIPYPLLYLPHANQSYSYQPYSYNMMNFLEFVSDKYAAYFGEYHFNGFLFNYLPLLKHLKWRAVVSFKVLFGGLSDKNNPEITPGLMAFPVDANGNPTTFILKNKPYMEAGIGIENIFKLFRVDLIKRLTYLNNPHVNQYGVRISLDVEF